jgi:hypothetical protein
LATQRDSNHDHQDQYRDREGSYGGHEEDFEGNADRVARTLSWKIAIGILSGALVIATAWVTTVSSVGWQLSRNCDVIQSRLAAIDVTLRENGDAILQLQRDNSARPSGGELHEAIREAQRLRQYIDGDFGAMKDIQAELKKLRDDVVALQLENLKMHQQEELKNRYGPYNHQQYRNNW